MTRLQTAFAWGPAAAFWWTARRTIVETDLCAPGAFFFAVFPPYCGWARSTQTLFLTSFFAITITLIGYTSVKFAEGLEYVYEKSYGLHRLWSHFSRLVHRQRPALMASACCWATSQRTAFHYYPRTGIVDTVLRSCTRASAGRRRCGARCPRVICCGGPTCGSAARTGQRQHVALPQFIARDAQVPLILQAAYALCRVRALRVGGRSPKTREAQGPTHRGRADPGCRVDGAALAKARARRSSCEAPATAAASASRGRRRKSPRPEVVQEACAAESESESEPESESESESESEERAAAKLRGRWRSTRIFRTDLCPRRTPTS